MMNWWRRKKDDHSDSVSYTGPGWDGSSASPRVASVVALGVGDDAASCSGEMESATLERKSSPYFVKTSLQGGPGSVDTAESDWEPEAVVNAKKARAARQDKLITWGMIVVLGGLLVASLLVMRRDSQKDSQTSRAATFNIVSDSPTIAPAMNRTAAPTWMGTNADTAGDTAVTWAATAVQVTLGAAEAEAYEAVYSIDQSGLTPPYQSGNTSFDEYMDRNPLHDTSPKFTEFWLQPGETNAMVVFDMGQDVSISGFSLWNVEDGGGTFAGIMSFGKSLSGPFGDDFVFEPVPHTTIDQPYPGQVFLLPSPVEASFVQLEMIDCTISWKTTDYCALAEIMWRVG